MSIGVAEVGARAARRPAEGALDEKLPLGEACLPGRQTLEGDTEADVRWAARAVRRNCSKGQARPPAGRFRERREATLAVPRR
jgi:hypothetical protein